MIKVLVLAFALLAVQDIAGRVGCCDIREGLIIYTFPSVYADKHDAPIPAASYDPVFERQRVDGQLGFHTLIRGGSRTLVRCNLRQQDGLNSVSHGFRAKCIIAEDDESARCLLRWNPANIFYCHREVFSGFGSVHFTEFYMFIAENNGDSRPLFLLYQFVRKAHFSQSQPDHYYGNGPQDKTDHSGPTHDLGEPRHGLLGIQVLLGALMISGGFYLLVNTVPKGWQFQREAFLVNCILGVLIVILGSLLCADTFFR